MKEKVIVDTNILFSAILNPNNKIGRLIINSRKFVQFYSCDFTKTELLKHRGKLLMLSGLSADELDELEFLITKNIIFISEELIPEETILATEKILVGIDLNDTPFVALTKHLKAKLWTGDKQLALGLEPKEYIVTLTTNQLSDFIDKLERN